MVGVDGTRLQTRPGDPAAGGHPQMAVRADVHGDPVRQNGESRGRTGHGGQTRAGHHQGLQTDGIGTHHRPLHYDETAAPPHATGVDPDEGAVHGGPPGKPGRIAPRRLRRWGHHPHPVLAGVVLGHQQYALPGPHGFRPVDRHPVPEGPRVHVAVGTSADDVGDVAPRGQRDEPERGLPHHGGGGADAEVHRAPPVHETHATPLGPGNQGGRAGGGGVRVRLHLVHPILPGVGLTEEGHAVSQLPRWVRRLR
jgi:hypothetical protein